ncbi:flagellar hook-length control protein FliK [Onishia taeanensis]
MSGITPLIDTLLHQVLGKRVDVPVPRELNAPVQPASPDGAVQALRSDSRLDPRQGAVAPPLVGRSVGQDVSLPSGSRPIAQPSTQTHFSPSAQTIANLLERFPAPPSTLRLEGPLMPTAITSSGDAPQVASRLQQSIETSGLFYESHLSKWYRGQLPRQQLMLEPQMQRATTANPFQQLTPAPTAVATTPLLLLPLPATQPGGGLLSTVVGSVPLDGPEASARGALGGGMPASQGIPAASGVNASPSASSTQAGGHGAHGGAGQAAALSYGVGPERPASLPPGTAERSVHAAAGADGLEEAQQSVVRHQLELLATPSPVLRWEGDVWSGVFMALIVQMPGGGQRGGEESASDEPGDEADTGAWQTQMSLQVAGLGKLDVTLRMASARLDIGLGAENQAVLSRLKEGEAALRSRLQACGFEAVSLQMTQHSDGGTA